MIGIFDSGSGGLTVLRALRRELPSADVVYFGDIKYAPYGSRTRAELTVRTVEALKLLAGEGATSIVSACNSVSASLAISLFDALAISPDRLIEMVGPTVSTLRNSPDRLLLVATQATIDSGVYQSAFLMVEKPVEVLALGELAGAIEKGASVEELADIIRDGFAGVDLSQIDAVVMACTHYPLAIEAFRMVLPTHIALIDPADAVARRVKQEWWPREVRNGKTRFIISADSEAFRARVAEFFPDAVTSIEVLQ